MEVGSDITCTWVAVSEHTKARDKRASAALPLATLLFECRSIALYSISGRLLGLAQVANSR